MVSLDTRTLGRLAILLLTALIIGGSLLYADYLARQLGQKERATVELYAEAVNLLGNLDSDPEKALSDINGFLLQIIQQQGGEVPKALLDEGGQVIYHTLPLPEGEAASRQQLDEWVGRLRREYEPVRVEFAPGRYNEVVYGESALLRQLRWFPLAQLLVALLFVAAVFGSFYIAQRNEQNRVWVGLAKETAHQLGTPVSSLMGWIELLKLKAGEESLEAISEMERDVARLENITERFSKIGSQPELQPVSLRTVLGHSAAYMEKRIDRRGKVQFEVINELPGEETVRISPQLFDWVIENLLKNALDALGDKPGKISIRAGRREGQYYIDVSDTGKGIPRNLVNKIFEPGFTTKKRGWGLGLSLSRRIIQHYHRGRIFVKASEPEKGSTFRILLPAAKAEG
jgi:signal transduction histidine kinase